MFYRLPIWDETDLIQIIDGCNQATVLALVDSLIQTNQTTSAKNILYHTFTKEKYTNNDGAYRLAQKALSPTDYATLLNTLHERDGFNERPLIWKAIAALDNGDPATAQALCQQAIGLDPSDGDQGDDDRMLVYKVLGQAAAAQGDEATAAFMKNVIAAIRGGEAADKLHAAGLHQRGINNYRAALEHFSDAYCLQSRLARDLANMGMWDAAEKHYQRAFELMPDSFGPMESHCFGCEGAFGNKTSQAIAEKVFTNRLEKEPNHARTHYLFGYLRASQDRHAEAFASYQKAAEIDPQYINAYIKMTALIREGHVRATLEQRTRLTIALLQLDPLQMHHQFTATNDLKTIYEAVQNIPQPPQLPKVDTLLALAQKPADPQQNHWVHSRSYYHNGGEETLPSPSEAVWKHPFLEALIEYLN